MKRIATAIAAMLVLACTGIAQGWSVEFARGPDPVVSRWPSWPHPTGCLGVAFDPVAVFSGPTQAENGSGGPELALRKYLDEGLYPQVPTRFWRLVAATDTRAYFASGRLEQGLFWLPFGLVDGQWRRVGDLDECRARTVRDGNVAVRWHLVPGQRLMARSRTIEVRLSGGPCRGLETLNGAAEMPEFLQVGGSLVMTIWLRPPTEHRCLKRKEASPLTVKLPRRLGKRQLWDGSSYPPRRER